MDEVNPESNGQPSPLKSALAYHAAGLSVIPILANGSKRPDRKWERFQRDPPSAGHVRFWWKDGRLGIALVCGKVSGGREVLDFDSGELFEPWCALVEAQAPDLIDRLCVIQTPADGFHVHYSCEEIAGNQKLAQKPGTDPKTGKPKAETLIETRGEGGYAILPGSPPACHPTGRTYRHFRGPGLTEAPRISADERRILLECARSFDLMATQGHKKPGNSGPIAGDRPGDDFNRRGPTWGEILGPHGWDVSHQGGAVTYWRRPGKEDRGHSATTGYCRGEDGAELLAVFSSNAYPFGGPNGSKNCTCYSKFSAYALLNHNGDFKAAARELAKQGYGRQAGKCKEQPVNGDGLTGLAVILDYFKERYQPLFRSGTAIYSCRLGRPVAATEACFGPSGELLEKLALADDAPTTEGVVKRSALPGFFRNWVKSAWTDLLDALPEEEDAEEVSDAATDEFKTQVAAALHRPESISYLHNKSGERVVERRSMLQWCQLFAKPGNWETVRSYRIWTCLDSKTGQFRIALRRELFAQLGSPALAKLGKKFALLCERYGVGKAMEERPCGERAIELFPEFIQDHLSLPPSALVESAAGVDCRSDCRSSETATGAPREETAPETAMES